jgi:hypothetical protein
MQAISAGFEQLDDRLSVRSETDPTKARKFADDVRDGKFALRFIARCRCVTVAEAHVLRRKAICHAIL